MANTIYIKSSQTGSSAPHATDDLKVGEIAVNTNDNKLFFKLNLVALIIPRSTASPWLSFFEYFKVASYACPNVCPKFNIFLKFFSFSSISTIFFLIKQLL